MACNTLQRAWDSTTDFFTDVWDSLSDAVQSIWKDAIRPVLGEAFSLLGIEGETVILVEKSTNLLLEGNDIDPVDDAKEKAVLSNIKKGGGFFRWYVSFRNRTSENMNTYYVQAKNGRYVHGLPTAEVREGQVDFAAIAAAVALDVGEPINVLLVRTRTPTDKEHFKENLQGPPYYYKPWNNTLTFADAGNVIRTDYKIDTVEFVPSLNRYHINIYRASDPAVTGVITRNVYHKKLSLVVRYHTQATPDSEWYSWIYPLDSDEHPSIKPDFGVLSDMEMLPAAIIKSEGVAINTDKNSEVYRSTRVLLSSIGLDIDKLIEDMSADPSYDLIEEAYINFSMSPTSTKEIVSKALWLSFYNIVVENPVGIGEGKYIATFVEQNIKNSAVWSSQTITYGLIGTLTGGAEYEHLIEPYTYQSDVDEDDGGTPTTVDGSRFRIRKANLAVPGTYDEIVINNFGTLATISKEGQTDVALQDIESPACTIPLSSYIVSQMSKEEQMYLFEQTLRLDVYAAQIEELAWYETHSFLSLFNGFLTIVSVVSLGSASGPIEVLKRMLKIYLIQALVVELAIRTGNEELAALIGMVAAIATGAIDVSELGMMEAESLLLASTNFADNLTEIYGVKMEGIAEEMAYINSEAERRLEEIDDALGDKGPINTEFMATLNSVDTTMYPARDAQYNFDLVYNYDSLIRDYYDLHFRTGVT